MIADFHNDILTSDQKDKLNELSLNTDLCVCAAFCGDRTFTEVRKIVEKFRCERCAKSNFIVRGCLIPQR